MSYLCIYSEELLSYSSRLNLSCHAQQLFAFGLLSLANERIVPSTCRVEQMYWSSFESTDLLGMHAFCFAHKIIEVDEQMWNDDGSIGRSWRDDPDRNDVFDRLLSIVTRSSSKLVRRHSNKETIMPSP